MKMNDKINKFIYEKIINKRYQAHTKQCSYQSLAQHDSITFGLRTTQYNFTRTIAKSTCDLCYLTHYVFHHMLSHFLTSELNYTHKKAFDFTDIDSACLT